MTSKATARRAWLPAGLASLAVLAVLIGVGLNLNLGTARDQDYDQLVAADMTEPPGTPLRDGFSVAEGSSLVGALFPVIEDPRFIAQEGSGPITSWRAQLLLIGEPLEVFNAYVGQAQAAGFPVVGGCAVQDAAGNDVSLAEYKQESAQLLQCRAAYQRSSRPNKSSTSVTIALERGERDGLFVSSASLRHVTIGDGTGEDLDYVAAAGPLSPVEGPSPALPEGPPTQLTKPGEALLPGKGDIDLILPKGSAQVAPAAGSVVCSGGYDTILSTPDATEAVLLNLRDQLVPAAPRPLEILEDVQDKTRLHTLTVDSAGGNNGYIVTALDTQTDHLIMVTMC